jgi:Flp pilus assembly protein TadD
LLLLAPADAWAWVILGNLNFRQNFALAERYFRRAVELSPTDPYAWNGMGVMYSEKHDFPKAIAAFESALKENPKFAHAHLGLATALADSGELRRAFEVLERMFSLSVVQDTRAMATFEQAGRFYRDLAKRLAQESIEVAEAEVETLTREAERVSGFQVQFEEGNFGVQMTASTELAWKHGRDHHVIRVRESLDAAAKLHMRAHELCHIIMEAEARNAGTNRWFSSNEFGWQLAQREIANELGPIRRTLPPPRAEELIERLFKGLMAQLYSLPLDMLIERRIATRHPCFASPRFRRSRSCSKRR